RRAHPVEPKSTSAPPKPPQGKMQPAAMTMDSSTPASPSTKDGESPTTKDGESPRLIADAESTWVMGGPGWGGAVRRWVVVHVTLLRFLAVWLVDRTPL